MKCEYLIRIYIYIYIHMCKLSTRLCIESVSAHIDQMQIVQKANTCDRKIRLAQWRRNVQGDNRKVTCSQSNYD